MKTHGIVQTSFDMSCTMWCRTVKITDTDRNWFCAALEVWSYRCTENTELILIGWFNTDYRSFGKHIWTYVQSSTGAIWRHILCICLYYFFNGLYELVLWAYRHLQTTTGICHSGCIQIRTEHDNSSILCCICFHSLKTSLCILQYTGALAHGNSSVCSESAFIPLAILVSSYKSLCCLMITKTKVGPVYVFLFHFDSFFLTFHFMCFILQLDRVAVKISSFLNHYFLL